MSDFERSFDAELIASGSLGRFVSADLFDSAITCLREIAAMGKKAGSERATQWLLQHGYPLEEGGYVPGRGFIGER